jgi:predicted metal-dependent phosphoesterase TrpH
MSRGRRAPESGRLVPPEPSVVDLHVHTCRSDGLLAPTDLVGAAAAAGIRTLAVTDHDTLAGYRELMAPGAVPLPAGLRVLAGVEINAVARHLDLPDGELHIVGLGVDPADEAFEAVLSGQRGERRRRFDRMRLRLRAAGLGVDAQLAGLDLDDGDALGRPTLARALVAAGFATSVQDAFARFVGRGGPGYAPREGLGPIPAIHAIRDAGGLPVLAHFSAAPSRRVLLLELMDAGLAGIEVHHRSFDAATVSAVGAVAEDLGLLPSGGTDYHGDGETYAEAIAETWVPPQIATGVMAALGAGIAP